jgi:hypothetical protein
MTVADLPNELGEGSDTEATFRIIVRGSKARTGEVAWAEQLKPADFELSDYERAVIEASVTWDGS